MGIFGYNIEDRAVNIEYILETKINKIGKVLSQNYPTLNIVSDEDKIDILYGTIFYILSNIDFNCLDVKNGNIEKFKVILKIVSSFLVDIFFIPVNNIYSIFVKELDRISEMKCNPIDFIVYKKQNTHENFYNKNRVTDVYLKLSSARIK